MPGKPYKWDHLLYKNCPFSQGYPSLRGAAAHKRKKVGTVTDWDGNEVDVVGEGPCSMCAAESKAFWHASKAGLSAEQMRGESTEKWLAVKRHSGRTDFQSWLQDLRATQAGGRYARRSPHLQSSRPLCSGFGCLQAAQNGSDYCAEHATA